MSQQCGTPVLWYRSDKQMDYLFVSSFSACADVMEKVQEALSTITDGVCHPLKVRVEQILSSGLQPIVLYAITNLVHFYRDVIKQVSDVTQCFSHFPQNLIISCVFLRPCCTRYLKRGHRAELSYYLKTNHN